MIPFNYVQKIESNNTTNDRGGRGGGPDHPSPVMGSSGKDVLKEKGAVKLHTMPWVISLHTWKIVVVEKFGVWGLKRALSLFKQSAWVIHSEFLCAHKLNLVTAKLSLARLICYYTEFCLFVFCETLLGSCFYSKKISLSKDWHCFCVCIAIFSWADIDFGFWHRISHMSVMWLSCRWFHGNIGREDAEKLLNPLKNGLFLVRESRAYKGDYTLCVW